MTELFRNTLSGWQWAILALVPPAIIALYFLKLRRLPLEVPSTYLWKRSIDDMHVNSLWQRLRQNLLMFLQLLLVALAILALLRPGWLGSRLTGQRFIFLIDNSESMSATDVDGARSRLAEAKELAEGLVDQMDSGMSAMVVSFAEKPQVVQEFTSNRRELRERIASIQPTAQGTNLAGALELANSLANAGAATATPIASGDEAASAEPPLPTAYILSDGRFEDAAGVAVDRLKLVYVPVGSFDAQNLAISALSVRRNEERPEEQQAFVQVANFTNESQKVVVELTLDGRFLDAAELEVPPGDVSGHVFPLAEGAVGGLSARLRYRLDGATGDSLPQDDVGYAALNDAGTGKVLVVTPGDAALELVLRTQRAARLATITFASPATLDSAEYRREAESGTYDLIIYDQCVPKQLPRSHTVFVGRLPPAANWSRSEDASGDGADAQSGAEVVVVPEIVAPQIIDWDHASPLLANVDWSDVEIADSLVVRPPAGGTQLIESTAGPIAAIAPRDNYQDAVLGFEIVGHDAAGAATANTNWPIKPAFPTFWLNVLEYLAAPSELQESAAVRPGRPVQLHAPANVERLTVVAPDGRETTVERSDQGTFPFTATNQPGVYLVRQGAAVIDRFAVALFDRAESKIGVQPTQDAESQTVRPADIRIGHVNVAATTDRAPSRREIWKVLLACALFVLLLEWYIYNRRVYL
jgi:von Willebrand factor type A domain/Aerotolerance regulator N-terminal